MDSTRQTATSFIFEKDFAAERHRVQVVKSQDLGMLPPKTTLMPSRRGPPPVVAATEVEACSITEVQETPVPSQQLPDAHRLYGYGERQITYSTEVAAPQYNQGVVIVQDYIGLPQQPGNQVVHADEAIQNRAWQRHGPFLPSQDEFLRVSANTWKRADWPDDSEGSESARRGAVDDDDHRDGGVKRPRSPTRPPAGRRHLPPPPAAPLAKRPRVVFSWDLPWADLVKASSEFKNKESWITCRACLKWFRRPSAFKQHLLMKVGVGQHPSSSATSKWDFNEMWDGEYEEYMKSFLPQQDEMAPLRVSSSAAGRPSVVKDADWFLSQMLEEEIARSEFHLASEDAWVPFVDDISQRLVKGLSDSDQTRDLSCSFPQIDGDNKVDFKVNMRWGVEDILAHLASKLGLHFVDLGSRWCIRLIGTRTVGNHKTFHLEIFFSPGKGENGLLRSVDPIPDTVKALLSPEKTEESVIVDEIPPEGEGTPVAPAGEVQIRPPSALSRAPTVGVSSHGLPAAVSGASYFDELVPDLMATVPVVTRPVVKRPPVAPPSGE
eukprot:symbB.v1.2.011788.t1/scaffold798.1/size257095/9